MTVRHIKAEYWETTDGAKHPTHEQAHLHEIKLSVIKVLSDCHVQTRDGLMAVAQALMNCPEILIVRAGPPQVREIKK